MVLDILCIVEFSKADDGRNSVGKKRAVDSWQQLAARLGSAAMLAGEKKL